VRFLSFGTRLVNRLMPTVDAHAGCKITGVPCYCLNHKSYRRICSYCEGSGGWCSACVSTNVAC
jgi:hypothetical protein